MTIDDWDTPTGNRGANGLLPFQAEFVAAVCRKERPVEIAALSVPRGNGKSWLCGNLVARSLTPGDPLHEPAVENVVVASSRPQAAIVMEFARAALGESDGLRWRKDGVEHIETRARARVISSDSRRALGLGAHVRLVIGDEPGAWPPTAGKRLWDAITTALGKRRMTVIAVGTLAPAPMTGPASWWPRIRGSGKRGRLPRLSIAGESKAVEGIFEVLRVNPVAAVNPYLRQTLEREHAAALKSERAARTFRQFRLISRRSGRRATANHGVGIRAGLCSPGPSVRRKARDRRRPGRGAFLERCRGGLAIWPNRSVGDCARSAVAGRTGAKRSRCRGRV